ncbi:acetyltransferase [Carboxylicivirga sediminis]|uniref:Acetyltransferase n=1 Tax=Carboxylicivirga sediminis TaxID=2006564 RepID=A0A941IZJ3_9BACT|nr:acetyltransferase [Carboxylicivirga sediminis]MBR8537389.1 acetyltransferase [Carboxylicivirga sediminis]
MCSTLLIFGGQSTAIEIFEVIKRYFRNDYDKVYHVIANTEEKLNPSYLYDSEVSDIANKNTKFIISFANHKLRLKIEELMNSLGAEPTNVIHPKAEISPSATIGKGNYIAANAVISSNVNVGDNNVFNYNLVVGHDTTIENHNIINPGVSIGGNCHIASRTLIGANSFILQGKRIGNDCIVDALTYIDRDIDAGFIGTNRDYDNLRVLRRIKF